jgi:putative membrane protein
MTWPGVGVGEPEAKGNAGPETHGYLRRLWGAQSYVNLSGFIKCVALVSSESGSGLVVQHPSEQEDPWRDRCASSTRGRCFTSSAGAMLVRLSEIGRPTGLHDRTISRTVNGRQGTIQDLTLLCGESAAASWLISSGVFLGREMLPGAGIPPACQNGRRALVLTCGRWMGGGNRAMPFLLRVLVLMTSMGLVSLVLPEIHFDSFLDLFLAALVVGIANAVLRPLLIFFTLPLVLLSVGLFIFVINAALLSLAAWIVPGFRLGGVWWTLLAAFLISGVSFILNRLVFAFPRRSV